MRSNR